MIGPVRTRTYERSGAVPQVKHNGSMKLSKWLSLGVIATSVTMVAGSDLLNTPPADEGKQNEALDLKAVETLVLPWNQAWTALKAAEPSAKIETLAPQYDALLKLSKKTLKKIRKSGLEQGVVKDHLELLEKDFCQVQIYAARLILKELLDIEASTEDSFAPHPIAAIIGDYGKNSSENASQALEEKVQNFAEYFEAVETLLEVSEIEDVEYAPEEIDPIQDEFEKRSYDEKVSLKNLLFKKLYPLQQSVGDMELTHYPHIEMFQQFLFNLNVVLLKLLGEPYEVVSEPAFLDGIKVPIYTSDLLYDLYHESASPSAFWTGLRAAIGELGQQEYSCQNEMLFFRSVAKFRMFYHIKLIANLWTKRPEDHQAPDALNNDMEWACMTLKHQAADGVLRMLVFLAANRSSTLAGIVPKPSRESRYADEELEAVPGKLFELEQFMNDLVFVFESDFLLLAKFRTNLAADEETKLQALEVDLKRALLVPAKGQSTATEAICRTRTLLLQVLQTSNPLSVNTDDTDEAIRTGETGDHSFGDDASGSSKGPSHKRWPWVLLLAVVILSILGLVWFHTMHK